MAKVSMEKYVDARIAALDKATALALDAVKAATEKDARHLRTWLTVLGVAVSAALGFMALHR